MLPWFFEVLKRVQHYANMKHVHDLSSNLHHALVAEDGKGEPGSVLKKVFVG